ncbi:MAG: Fe-S cluster assembly protein SufD [Bdellovibrio sp.]
MNLLSSYEKFNQTHPAQGALASFRQAGYDYALRKGLPTRKDEEWHYTSVKSLEEAGFQPVLAEKIEPSHETLARVKAHLNPAFTNIVFINGVLNKTLSEDLPRGFTLREFAGYGSAFDDTFDALNGAYSTGPLELAVAPEVSVEKPVNFIFYTSAQESSLLMNHPRLKIEVGSRSVVKFLESHYGDVGTRYFVNSVLDLKVQDSASVTYVRLQSESDQAVNVGRTRIVVGKQARLESLAFASGASLSRHSLEVSLKGAGSSSEVLGVYAVRGTQHVDNTSLIDHAVGDCQTNQLYKGILDDEARAVFCGKVLIQKGAQKANSAQLNNNMLMSAKAEADSKPSLEIYADDVKASHGSTVGQLNREELFYLQSRAIPKAQAIPMLSYGFLSEVIYKISDESIRKWLAHHLDQVYER